MNLPFNKLTQAVSSRLADNSAAILTATGVVGTITTAGLSARAGLRCAHILEAEEMERQTSTTENKPIPIERLDIVRLTWKEWLPPTASAGLTVGAIVFAHRANAAKIAGLAAAYGVTQDQFKDYREKVEEKLGLKKEREMRDEINQDRVNANPPKNNVVIMTGGGDVLTKDAASGRYFRSSVEKVMKAVNSTNTEIRNHMSASLSYFYSELELPENAMSDWIGWNDHVPCDVHISATLTDNDEPCMVFEFVNPPFSDYGRTYG